MQFKRAILLASSLVTAALATKPLKNESQEFRLKTQLTPGQTGKADFSGLYVSAYHTGAGFNDAVFANRTGDIAFLNGTKGQSGDIKYQNLVFDLGSGFPWQMIPEEYEEFYALWEPVVINAGSTSGKDSGFFIDDKGLQWTQSPHLAPSKSVLGGWLACDWVHGGPQLFFIVKQDGSNGKPITPKFPCSCAEVNLIPEYI